MDEQFSSLDTYIGMPNVLIKGDAKDKNVIYIQASNELEDSEGDTILRKALETEADRFLKRGVISFDHLHKLKHDPEYIIGEPLDVKFTDDNSTLVKAKLYTGKNKHAQTIKNLADEGSTRLGASVGGAILGRKKVFDTNLRKARNYICKVLWDEVAVTHKPVNEFTLGSVSTIPYEDFRKAFMVDDGAREELVKALMAGGGTDSATMTGGRALVSQSLMGSAERRNLDALTTEQSRKVLKANSDLFGALVKNVLKSRREYSIKMLKATLAEHGYSDERAMFSVLPSLTELVKYLKSYLKE